MSPKYVGHDKQLAFTFETLPKMLSGMNDEELVPVYKEELLTRSLGMRSMKKKKKKSKKPKKKTDDQKK